MTKRWKQRPPGSTWGDWGDDDELGRINLLTPEKVLAGRARGRGRHQLLPEPAARLPGRHRAEPAAVPAASLAPTEDMDGNPDTFYNVHMSEMPECGDPKYVDVWADDVVTLSLQYSTQWDSLAHVGAEFDADGDGVEEAVYYNGYRAGRRPRRTEATTPRATAAATAASRTTSAWSTWRSTACRAAACSSTSRTTSATSGAASTARRSRRSWRPTTSSSSPATCCCCTPASRRRSSSGTANPDPGARSTGCARTSTRTTSRCSSGSPSRRSPRSSPTTTRSRDCVGKDRDPSRHSFLPIHHLCLFKLGVPLGEMWYLHELATWLREHDRSRFLLTAPPLRLPGIVGSPLTPVATV